MQKTEVFIHTDKNVSDEIRFVYQTEKWDKPAKFVLKALSSTSEVATVEAKLVDAKGVLCLDARNFVRLE
jgi:beta-galactosidase